MTSLRDQILFFRQFRQRFETTGAVLPSSRFLARAMTRPLARCSGPRRILEVGPGTGAVTGHIVREVKPEDRFDLVEINQDFARLLQDRFQSDPNYLPAAPVSNVHVCPLQDFAADGLYDVIISGLPFNNFPAELVESLVDRCLSLLKPGGTFSLFEYMFIRPIRVSVTRGPEKERLAAIERIMQTRFQAQRVRRDWIFINVPPAWVQHLQRPVEG
ncbi:AdoMet dependent proline di-methyltransferase [Caulifigura coniformis]|uniref:AdoMet dependent proline di-methyltransferase n=1 Tax=Caulifigura coniformis TaxID=2527983 RepID=A0A517SK86_9PLAN|nr:methyltransferase domain-containing protein [Caulifigura coniformis]QDT56539.1 AdoMet dependent proline di-methyltransferase [Caulifigura coniformis]